MKKIVLAISREYGSGGSAVGRKLATELGIPFYDKAIIEMAAEKSGLSSEYIDKIEETITSSFLFNLVSSYTSSHPNMVPQGDMPISYTAYSAQAAVIRELAKRGSCVIVGRCSEYILHDNPNCIKIFIYADTKTRVQHTMQDLNLDEKAATARLAKIDKGRANYYKNFTGEDWGSLYSHDICINSTHCGVDGAVETVKTFLKCSGLLD